VPGNTPFFKKKQEYEMKRVTTVCLILATLLMAEYVPFKVKLNMLERLTVISLLPKETNFANWKIINDLKNQLSPTEKELTILNPQTAENGGLTGNWDAVPEKEITFGEVTEKMVVDALKELDENGKLLAEHLSLYEKFIVRGNEQE
jgi:hypothetical protein